MAQDYHEDITLLDEEARNMVRALCSLKEEIEAVDWYHQRIAATKDESLKEILIHNRDEEIEHAIMSLEWLRRNGSPAWHENMKEFLFKDGEITDHHEGEESSDASPKSLGIGKL